MNEIEENTNLFSSKGYIKRRNYIINFFIILTVCIFVLRPFVILNRIFLPWTVPLTELEYEMAKTVPSAFFAFDVAIYVFLEFFNIRKRIHDIKGKPQSFFLSFLTFCCLLMSLLLGVFVSPCFISFAVIIEFFMFITPGKNLPTQEESEIVKFNWGAFFGTCIWGLINKTYISFLIILLLLSNLLCVLPFCFILGLKGNEWAYANRRYKTIEEFHKSQKMQAKFWIIFLISIVVLFFMLCFAFIFILISALAGIGAPH